MSADAEKLLQLVNAVRAREPVPATLGPWLADLALSSMSAIEREEARNECIQRAAALIPGKRWAKMRGVKRELDAVRGEWTLHSRFPPMRESLTAHVVDALFIDWNTPSSISQLLRILKEELVSPTPLT